MRRLSSVCVMLGVALVVSGCAPSPSETPPKAERKPVDSKPAKKGLVGLEIGQIAPDIEGQDLDGKHFKLSDYRGKVVLLDFWGHW